MLARLYPLLNRCFDRMIALRPHLVALHDRLLLARDRLLATLDAFLQPPGNDDAFYVALAARREPVFRDLAPAVSPWAGRRRAAVRASRSEAA